MGTSRVVQLAVAHNAIALAVLNHATATTTKKTRVRAQEPHRIGAGRTRSFS